MNDIAKQSLEKAVCAVLGTGSVTWTTDVGGNAFGWAGPCRSQSLPLLAPALARAGARLLTVTAYRNDKFAPTQDRRIAYHFDLDGVVATVTVALDEDASEVPSITPWFANADWNEREFAELYGIGVAGHPNPRRLFLDKELDAKARDQMVPLSILMNGASTTTLWERVFAGKPLPDWAKGGRN